MERSLDKYRFRVCMGSKMYLYLKCFYEQWCSGQDDADIIERSEVFIDMIHDKIGFDKDTTREFLYKEPWFKKPVQ